MKNRPGRHHQHRQHHHNQPSHPQHHFNEFEQPQPIEQGQQSGNRKRIAFDLDETLGAPLIEGQSVSGFQYRDGARELLQELGQKHDLILWSHSNRPHVDRLLRYGLARFFRKTYSWNEQPGEWKDIRKINVDFLIDANEQHREKAKSVGIENRYIIVQPYGSYEDEMDPTEWVRTVRQTLTEAGLL
jgi:FMN phosphatase YigB (HAD superfamily)